MQQTLPTPPAPPEAPAIAPAQITVGDLVLTTPQATYQGFRAQRRELSNQLERLQESREELALRLESTDLNEGSRKAIEQRVASTDERIATVEKQLMEADANVALSAAAPGATVELPEPSGSDGEGIAIVSSLFVVFVLMPIAVAYARRLWRRSAKVVTTFPKELSDRLIRVEQAVEATAVEIERIGEGQRFMTRIFTEGATAAQVGQPQHARIPATPKADPST